MSTTIDTEEIEPLLGGLLGGVDVASGPTDEQLKVLGSLAEHLWQRPDLRPETLTPRSPAEVVRAIGRPEARLRFCEILMTLELCRHPQSEAQVQRAEEYVAALDVGEIDIQTTREVLEQGADAAARDLERFYEGVLPEISEVSLRAQYLHLAEPDHELAERLRSLHRLPEGTLGHEYVEFYRRNGITLPGDDIRLPAHYVNHDMNHVITGYEPTAPGEVARSGFLWAADDNRRNWLELLLTLSIHETGVLNHGDIRAKVSTLDREGVSDLFGEGLKRGSQCTVDLSQIDHLALVNVSLREVRDRFSVVPLTDPIV